MRPWSLVLAVFLLALTRTASAYAQQAVLSCDTKLRWGYVSELGVATHGRVVLEGAHRVRYTIDTGSLTFTMPDAATGVSRRIGSKKISHVCGPFTFIFSSGWFNPNPLGEMGADEFSVFEVLRDGSRVLGPLALGVCGYGGLSWGRCPVDWVVSATFQWQEHAGQSTFLLERAFQERRAVP